MKLATLATPGGPEVCLIDENRALSLATGLLAPVRDMIDLISRWPEIREAVEVRKTDASAWRAYARTDLLAPVPRPGKMFAIGLNYLDHIEETGQAIPEHQIWFSKQAGATNGPFQPVEIPRVSNAVDYEAELVFVIGKRGRHISEAEAPAHVFGYCVGNDVSARDWQKRTPQWDLGKSFDTHAPFGPWITTADEVGDPHRLDIRCTVNGGLRQSSNTGRLCFNVWQQIAYLSQVMTLEPGDVVYSGTPGGVGLAMDPPQFLKAGDVVRCEIEGLGAIENNFVAET
jgi:2-keto-4-pentenoate hydratase/2-oxohepta-3-ene-1,7-dioic acid hydratase in catechol pathway